MNKYKEALERARMSYHTGDYNKDTLEMLEIIFPELKESEDEKIRGKLMSFFRRQIKFTSLKTFCGIPIDDIIAWLEKQGEQKPVKTLEEVWKEMRLEVWAQASGNKPTPESDDSTKMFSLCDIDEIIEKMGEKQIVGQVSYPPFTFDDILALQCAMANAKESDEDLYKALQSLHDRVHDLYHGEQKENEEPTDKPEPKFKTGDWIVNKGGEIAHIDDLKEDYYHCTRYYLSWTNGVKTDPLREFVEDDFRLWTIQDAKPGDVLYTPNGQDEYYILILKNIRGRFVFGFAACYYYNDGSKSFDKNVHIGYNDKDGYYPATKEQQDLLFKRMQEAGYEWDSEKLKLEETNQNNEQSIDSVNHSMYIRCLGILSMIKCGIEVTEVDEELEWLKSMAKWN